MRYKFYKLFGIVLVFGLIVAIRLQGASAAGKSRAPESIGTTLAFDDGKVVTIKYTSIPWAINSWRII